ncbi:MAG: AtpZ/AtpI family protein [Lachnospiraceae bacterium]|nr:AtpZ/AtpI family protein [Lachnospiraceae bacterium]
MSRKKEHYDKSVYRSLTLIMQFGINMLVPICVMSVLGIWLDNKFGTSYLMIVLFFLGAIAGGQNVYKMARSIYREKESHSRDESNSKAKKDKQNPS